MEKRKPNPKRAGMLLNLAIAAHRENELRKDEAKYDNKEAHKSVIKNDATFFFDDDK